MSCPPFRLVGFVNPVTEANIEISHVVRWLPSSLVGPLDQNVRNLEVQSTGLDIVLPPALLLEPILGFV